MLSAMSLLSHMALAGTRITVILSAVHLGASPAVIGLLSALQSLLPMFTSVWAGRWMDRVGPRFPMLLACVMTSVGILLGFLFPGLEVLFAVNLIIGTFTNLFLIANQGLVGRYGKPEERVGNFALNGLAYSTAAFIGPIVAGFSIDHLGHSLTFLEMALLPAIPAVVLILNKLEFPPREKPHAQSDQRTGTNEHSTLALMRAPGLAPTYIAAALSQATWTLFSFLMPVHLASYGLSASAIGTVVGIFYFASMASRVFLPWIARRFTPWQLLLTSFGGGALSFFGFPLTDNVLVITLLSAWLGTVLGFTGPMLLTLLHEASPPGRSGAVVGIRVMLMNVTQTLVPLAAGAVGAAFGVAPAFVVLGLAMTGGGWLSRREDRRSRSRREARGGH